MKLAVNNLLLFTILVYLRISECVPPTVYYAPVGSPAMLQCTSGGNYVCFSTYTFQSITHQMAYLNNSAKYNYASGMLTVNNVQPTDAGFYACSNDCTQMKSDLISYYLQPMCKNQKLCTETFL